MAKATTIKLRSRKQSDAPSRTRIIEAATKLFQKKPFVQISIDDIANEAGVAHGLAFHYFGSKETLYELVSQAAADRLDDIHALATRTGSPPERLRAFLTAHVKEVGRRRVDYVYHSRGGGTPNIQAIWESSRRTAIRLILSFYDLKEPSPMLEVAVRAWLGYFDELVLAWAQGQAPDQGQVVEMTLRLFPMAIRNAELLGVRDLPEIVV